MKKLRVVLAAMILMFTVSAAAVPAYAQSTCGGTKTQLIACDNKSGIGAINEIIRITISVMTVLIGIAATGGIAYGALLYASAHDDQGKVSEAITIIRNVVIGIVLYGFTIAIINWLVPGGVIG